MIIFGIISIFLVTASAEYCYEKTESACSTHPATSDGRMCNASYGSFENMQAELQAYAKAHIDSSFEYLLLSAHFGNYESNREGFKKLYRKLSDNAWKKAIDIIQFITKRGGRMNFNQQPHFLENLNDSHVLQLNELSSLAKALDKEKQLANEAIRLYTRILSQASKDTSVIHFLEEKFMESQAEVIRSLAGLTNDLKNLLGDNDGPVSLFWFDEELKKQF